MSTPTVPVTVDLAAMGGPALAGITVRATLDGNEVYTGIVVAKRVEAVTDASGVAILNLFPNAPAPTGLGTQGTTYRFSASVPGGRGLNVDARVPNLACRLENILVLDEVGPLSAAELALLQAQSALSSMASISGAAATAAATAVLNSKVSAAALAAADGSSLVGFQQSGTGSVPRTIQAKAREVVTAQDFGATGDGSADDGTAMTNLMTYIKANGLIGYLPPGTYRCRNLRMESGTEAWALVGAGKDLTTIEHSDGNGTLLFGNLGSSVPYTLADFTVDCKDSAYGHPSANNAISFCDTQGVKLHRIRVRDYANNGILGFVTAPNTFGYCEGIDCEAIGNGAGTDNGMLFVDMPGCKWIRCKGKNILGSPGYAVQLKNDCRDGQMIDCIGDTCNGAVIFGNDGVVRGVSRSQVSGARSYNCGVAFIADDSNTNSVHFAHIDMNAIVNNALRFESASVGNTVRVDVIEGLGAARAAVRFFTGSTDNFVEVGAILNGAATSSSALFDAGADRNTVVVHRKPTLHSGGLSNEATFSGITEMGNRFVLDSVSAFGVTRTIAAGVITVPNASQKAVVVETEAAAATDDLDTITANGEEGRVITLRSTNSARDIVVKHNTGNIVLNGSADFTLSDRADALMLVYNAVSLKWCEIGRGNNL